MQIKNKVLFIIIIIGWFIFISMTIYHIIFALKHNYQILIPVSSNTIIYFLFPFLSNNEPLKWVSYKELFKIIVQFSIIWGILTLIWILQEKNVLMEKGEDDWDWGGGPSLVD